MSHLSAERLAALVDEPPTPAELSHLAGCAVCSRERASYVSLAEMARNAVSLGQPLSSWDKLAPRLRQDGVIETGRGFGRRAMISRGWLQAAAAAFLLVGGAALGRITARPEPRTPAPVSSLDTNTVFHSVAEAQAAATRSQSVYQASLAWLAMNDSSALKTATPAAIKTRLAALDRVSQIVGAALEDAPYDSVINTMYLNAQGQREASIKQLSTAPMRASSY
jgi:hypothetical protein